MEPTTTTGYARTRCECEKSAKADTNSSGYKSSPFPLKASQQSAVARILAEGGFMPQELVPGEVDWFYNHLGIGEFKPNQPS
jgi:hypothetical protein